MDISILYSMSTKENFLKYSKFIKKHLVTKEVYTIFTDLREWYKTHDDVDWSVFPTWFKLVKHASMTTETLEIYDAMFNKLTTYSPSSSDLEVIHTLIAREYAARISNFTGDIADGVAGDLMKVEDIMREYSSETGRAVEIEEKFVTDDIDEIMSTVIRGGGYNWRLKELNLMLGPLRTGDFITFGARPDSGKTTMLASEVTYMTEQMDDDLLTFWFCNEEAGNKVKFRIEQAALGITTSEFESNPKKWDDEYVKMLRGQRVRVLHDTSLHMNDVEQVCSQYSGRVGLIVLDQLHKIRGFESKEGNEVVRQTMLFNWARNLSSIAPVLNVHQLKGEAEGKMFPEMDMLYGSTTMIQGECDAVVTLGRSHDTTHHENARGIYAPKNKLVGDLKSGSKYRNTKFEIEIQGDIGRFTGAMK